MKWLKSLHKTLISEFVISVLICVVAVSFSPPVIAAPFAYIPNLLSNSVTVIDTADDTVTGQIPVSTKPRGVALHPNGKRAYVITSGNGSDIGPTIEVIDTALAPPGSNSVLRSIPLPASSSPAAIAISPNGESVYVTLYAPSQLAIAATASLEPSIPANISSVSIGNAPTGLAVHPSGTRIYVATNGHTAAPTNPLKSDLFVYNLDGNPHTVIAVDFIPQGVAVSPDGSRVYVSSTNTQNITVIDATNNQVIVTRVLPISDQDAGSEPAGVAVHPDGSKVYVADRLSGFVSILDTSTNSISGQIALPASSEPFGLSVHPDGTRLYVTQGGSNTTSVIKTTTLAITSIGVGIYPITLGNFIQQKATDSACHAEPQALPTSRVVTGLKWRFKFDLSGVDGLVLTELVFAERSVATRFSLPYYKIRDASGNPIRCQLIVNGTQNQCRSTLVKFLAPLQISDSAVDTFAIAATYQITNLPGNPDSCIEITQRYEFRQDLDNAGNPITGCDPSARFACARFFPLVKYEFKGAHIDNPYVNVVQRFQFADSEPGVLPTKNSVGLFHDCDDSAELRSICLPHPTAAAGGNPLLFEVSTLIIKDGESVVPSQSILPFTIDNFHQTFKGHISEPNIRLVVSGSTHTVIPLPNPGCPECVHIHWRWGKINNLLAPFTGFSDPIGVPLVRGSNQDVEIAIVRDQDVVPGDFHSLFNRQSLVGIFPVLYYSAIGKKNEEIFFSHGGFLDTFRVEP